MDTIIILLAGAMMGAVIVGVYGKKERNNKYSETPLIGRKAK